MNHITTKTRSKINFFTTGTSKVQKEKRRQELVDHLNTALQLEHATVPPYFYTLCSIKPNKNLSTVKIIKSVLLEEMLHMALVANLLIAVQKECEIKIYFDGFIPEYPAYLPNSDQSFKVSLTKFSKEAIHTFLNIERPSESDTPQHANYASIGQFYAAIKDETHRFCDDFGEKSLFIGKKDKQILPEYYFNGGGELIQVVDLESARKAIKVIADEGEGHMTSIFSGDHENFQEKKDLAHYFKFNQIFQCRKYNFDEHPDDPPAGELLEIDYSAESVHQICPDVDISNYPEIEKKTQNFEIEYWNIIKGCEDAFNGTPDRFYMAYESMREALLLANELVNIEIGNTGVYAGPRFNFPKSSYY